MDTHKIVKRLQEAGFSNVQAETVTDVLREGKGAKLSLIATKADLASLENILKIALGSLEIKLKADLASLESKLKADLADVKADMFKWSVPLLLGQAALIAALVKLL